jgi:hypothetical protein
MRIEFTSGAWVECRDNLLAGDKRKTQEAVKFTISDGQTDQVVDAAVQLKMTNALLANIIVDWSYAETKGWPIPANNPGGVDIIDQLDIDDYNELSAGVDELVKKVSFRGDRTPN